MSSLCVAVACAAHDTDFDLCIHPICLLDGAKRGILGEALVLANAPFHKGSSGSYLPVKGVTDYGIGHF